MKTEMIVPTTCIDHILEVLPVRRGVGYQRLSSAPVRMCMCADQRQEDLWAAAVAVWGSFGVYKR